MDWPKFELSTKSVTNWIRLLQEEFAAGKARKVLFLNCESSNSLHPSTVVDKVAFFPLKNV